MEKWSVHRGPVGPAPPRAHTGARYSERGVARTGRQGGMLANAGGAAGLLVSREHELVLSQVVAFPVPRHAATAKRFCRLWSPPCRKELLPIGFRSLP